MNFLLSSTKRNTLVAILTVLLLVAAYYGSRSLQNQAHPANINKTELVLAVGGEPENGFDPTMGWGRYGSPLFHSTLFVFDADLRLQPDLATDYRVSEDGLTWTVHIRPGAMFSDGVPMTTDDVAYTFNTASKSGGVLDMREFEQAVAVDGDTVEFQLKKPISTFVHRLATLGIVPQHAHGANYARHPIGSGPYQLVVWDEGQQLVVERNPYYYGVRPKFTKVTFLFLNTDSAYAAAQTGQIDLLSVPQSLAAKTPAGMKLISVPSVDNRGVLFPYVPDTGDKTAEGFPIGNNVTSQRSVRLAVNHAIDRNLLVNTILEGHGTPALGSLTDLPWEQKLNFQDGNVQQARAVMLADGWGDADGDNIFDKDGLKAEFTLLYPASDPVRQTLALAVRDMLIPAGIQIEVRGKSWDEIRPLMHSTPVLFGWGSLDQTETFNLFYSMMAGQDWYNPGYYANSQVDHHLQTALESRTEAEATAAWQAAQWDGETGMSVLGDAPWAWLVNLDHTYFANTCLNVGRQRIQPHEHGWPITFNIQEWGWACEP